MTEARETVIVRSTDEVFLQNIDAAGHRLTADEPRDVGGTDQGPTPYGLLLAALGSCTSMTMRLYAQRKGFDLRSVEVELFHERVHARDCADCETKEGKVSVLYRRITVRGDLSDEQRSRLLDIANRCPVHRTLTSEISIRTELVPA